MTLDEVVDMVRDGGLSDEPGTAFYPELVASSLTGNPGEFTLTLDHQTFLVTIKELEA